MKTKITWKQQNSVLPMSKFIFCILTILGSFASLAQKPMFSVNSSNNYTSVHDYNGRISNNAYELKWTYSGTNLNVPYWRMSVRLKQPIFSTDGLNEIPSDKISFNPIQTQGQATPNPIPSLAQIGTPANVALNGLSEVFLVPQSNAPLYNVSQYNSYYYLQLHYNLNIAGGAYLEPLQGGNTQKRYMMVLEFKAYGSNNEILGIEERTYTIDIFRLSGTPPVSKKYSIAVSANAANALLELKSISDYANGTSVTYNNGVSVTSNTDYELTVRSLFSQFNSPTKNLPLDLIRLELLPASNSTVTISPINISENQQRVAQGVSTQNAAVFYHLRYSSQAGDTRLINTPSGTYTTRLEFQIIPK
jgi:hypothetical protein